MLRDGAMRILPGMLVQQDGQTGQRGILIHLWFGRQCAGSG
jgi:hypothetical protein